ncbi:MAG: hypothetical protein ACRC10_03510 [Thermoguttaceae bacterium]
MFLQKSPFLSVLQFGSQRGLLLGLLFPLVFGFLPNLFAQNQYGTSSWGQEMSRPGNVGEGAGVFSWLGEEGQLPAQHGAYGGSSISDVNMIAGESGPGFLERVPRRTGSFQSISVSKLWIPTGSTNTLGIMQFYVGVLFGLAMPDMESPLLITPSFSPWILDANSQGNRDKKTLYSADCEFRWSKPLFGSPRYKLELAARPGWYSDLKSNSWESFRVPVRAGLVWNYNPRTTWVLGCGYLDRSDYKWMPYGGVIWVPNGSDWVFSLLFPEPKIAKQIKWWGGAVGKDTSNWLFLAGEAGNGRWSYKDGDYTGMMEYRDYRFCIGWERKSTTGINIAFELGGVFWRRLSETKDGLSFDPKESLFLRLRGSF